MKKICSIKGCNDVARKRGWCLFHYDRWLRKGDPLAGGPRRASPNSLGKCIVEGCDKKARALNYCHNHYMKFKKHGDPLGGYTHDGRSKQWRQDKNGYIYRWEPSNPYANKKTNLVFQHRQVMGEYLGRVLSADESVHHKNGMRSDNRIENLELWARGQPAGQRVKDQIKWARSILAKYGDIADKLT